MPVRPAPTTVTGASGCSSSSASRSRSAYSNSADGMGEFGRTRHRRRCRTGAADRVDDVVVVQRRRPDAEFHGAGSGVDPGGTVDDQLDAFAEQRAVVGRGVAGARDELVQPDPLDELRARVDQRDVDVGAQPQMVGRESFRRIRRR